MAKRSDPELVLRALPPEDREAVTRWSRRLGLGDTGWARVPSFHKVVELLAIASLSDALRANDPDISERGALYVAAGLVGLDDDDPDLDTHPADTPRRRLNLWLRRAGRKKVPDAAPAERVD